jgi:hypothetical protein
MMLMTVVLGCFPPPGLERYGIRDTRYAFKDVVYPDNVDFQDYTIIYNTTKEKHKESIIFNSIHYINSRDI